MSKKRGIGPPQMAPKRPILPWCRVCGKTLEPLQQARILEIGLAEYAERPEMQQAWKVFTDNVCTDCIVSAMDTVQSRVKT